LRKRSPVLCDCDLLRWRFGRDIAMLKQLHAGSARLLAVQGAASDWSYLVASWPGSALLVGADSWARIMAGLVSALSPSALVPAGEIDGTAVGFVFTLQENHGTLYSGRDGDSVVLFFQNAAAELIGRMVLDRSVRDAWSGSLCD